MPYELVHEATMVITKASFDKNTGAMRFRMVSSDIGPDIFGERMSLELFNDFVSRIEKSTPVEEPFKSILAEKSGWEGGLPYVSVAHYKSGVSGANIPADTEKVYVDGEKLKAVACCRDTELGKAVYEALKADQLGTSEYDDKIRVSIGFLDLKHSHGDFVFERTTLENRCPMCENKVGNKVYLKGQLVHLALTRKPANPRTDAEVEMSEIKTKKEDAESIVGKTLAEELEVNKSEVVDEILVVKAEEEKAAVMDEEEMEDECTGKDGCQCKACSSKKKEEKSEVAEVVETPVEKSAFDLAVDSLKLRIEQVKSLPREEALQQLQPDFELVAKSVQDQFPAPQVVKAEMPNELVGALAEIKSVLGEISGKVQSLSSEVAVLKSQVSVSKSASVQEVPAPKNLQIERSLFPDLNSQKPKSIRELALSSVQG